MLKFLLVLRAKWKLSLVTLGAVLVPVAYAAANDKLPGQTPQVTYKTVTPSRQSIEESLSVSGEVAAEEHVALRFQGSALLSWVGVKEGDSVKKGQALAKLDTRSLKKNLAKDLNDFMKKYKDFDQTQDDYRTARDALVLTDAMKRILDKSGWDLQNAAIDYELSDLAVKLATLITPIEGIVTKIDTPFAGVNITPAGAEFEVVNPQTLYFSAEIDETDVGRLKAGMPVKINLDAFEGEQFDGQLVWISFVPKSGTSGTVYEAKISLPAEAAFRFKLGMNGDATIRLALAEDTLSIPFEAATDLTDSEAKVKVLRSGKPEEVTVKVGLVSEDKLEVLGGLTEGDQVIVGNEGK